MANVAIFVSAVITFFIPFLIVFAVLYSAGLKKKKGGAQGKLSFELPKLHLGGQPSPRQSTKPYAPHPNTADYPSACQASYNPQRAKDQLDTLLRAGHLTRQEYAERMEQLKNYKHC